MIKHNPKKILLLVLMVLLVILAGYTCVHLIANYANIKIDLLSINPNQEYSIQPTFKILQSYDYPQTQGLTPILTLNGSETVAGLPLFSITIAYAYNGTLAEDTCFALSSNAAVYPEGQKTLFSIQVGYSGAVNYDSGFSNSPALLNSPMFPENSYTIPMLLVDNGQTPCKFLKWDTQGDYYPYLLINFKNLTTTQVNLQDWGGKIHVYGHDALVQEEAGKKEEDTSRRNIALTFDIFLLPSSIVIFGFLLKKYRKDDTAPYNDKDKAKGKKEQDKKRIKEITRKQ